MLHRLAPIVAVLALLLASGALGCAYPRRSTSLSPLHGRTESDTTPADLWSLTLASAQIPPRARGGRGWDGDSGLPDPFLRIYRDGVLVWESPAVQDSLTPEWNAELPHNFLAPRSAELRFELWDRDEIGADPIGALESRGLPQNVVVGADARVMLEGGAQLSLDLGEPHAHHGVGIRLYEVRGDALVVLEVETYSPAGRAGILPGDAIVRIGEQTVAALGMQRAPGALSMAAEHHESLWVRNARGQTREVPLDRGYTWLAM